MATKSVITKIRRKKMAEASHTTGTVAKITHIALGSGGVNADGTVIVPLAENVALKKEVVRKPYTSSTKTSDTSYEYTIKLEEDELVGTFISEMALIDEDGDVVAFSNFLAKGKDETEVTFTIISIHAPTRGATRFRAIPEITHRKYKERGIIAPMKPEETPDYSFRDLQLCIYHTITI